MTEFEKRQDHVNNMVCKAINGEISKEEAVKATTDFEKWLSETSIGDLISVVKVG